MLPSVNTNMGTGNTVLDAFPNLAIRPFEEKPSYFNLLRFCKQLIENATSLPSPLGDGAHRHSGLILPDASYFWKTGSHFVRPVFPVVIPIIAPSMLAAPARVLRNIHASDIRIFTTCIVVESAVRKMTISVIPNLFLETTKLPITGLVTVAVR